MKPFGNLPIFVIASLRFFDFRQALATLAFGIRQQKELEPRIVTTFEKKKQGMKAWENNLHFVL